METATKNCLSCGKPVKGRSDKKFCDDYCRNSYNNQRTSCNSEYQRSINTILRRNRRILSGVFQGNQQAIRTSKEKLLLKGFCFKHMTHLYTNKKGKTYFFCYEYGYQVMEPEGFLLVVKDIREGPRLSTNL